MYNGLHKNRSDKVNHENYSIVVVKEFPILEPWVYNYVIYELKFTCRLNICIYQGKFICFTLDNNEIK